MDIINCFEIENETFYYYDISKVFRSNEKLKKLPIVLKILLEANLRKTNDSIEFNRVLNVFSNRMNSKINLYPSRIIMQEYLGIPSLVDLASMRDSLKAENGDETKVNPQIMVDLVIDNSLHIFDTEDETKTYLQNQDTANKEKFEFAKWAQNAFSNLRVVPPGSGICHQVNLEYLSTILHLEKKEEKFFIYPETLVGTDSNMTMINSLGVLGVRVDGVKAESSILGHPVNINLSKVVGVKISGELKEAINSTDLALIIIENLKKHSLDGELVEFYGDGLKYLTLEDRSNISNMASKYGATCSFFAIDDKTIEYFNKTRGSEDYGQLLKKYLTLQNLFYNENEVLDYDEIIEFDLSQFKPIIYGSKGFKEKFEIRYLKNQVIINNGFELKDTDIVLALITSCSALSTNPYQIIHAALVAKKAIDFGLKVNKNVRTVFSPKSFEVKEFLEKLDLLKYLEELGFKIEEFGCSINHENFKLDKSIESDIRSNNLNVSSVVSGIDNLEHKIHPMIKSNYLMSPSLVLIYSITGTTKFDLFEDVLGVIDDKDIKLKDIWPLNKEVGEYLSKLDNTLYKDIYKDIFKGNEFWQKLHTQKETTFSWDERSTYIQPSNLFEDILLKNIEVEKAGILALLGDNITTDQISPIGQIPIYSTAAKYLESKGIRSFEYNSFRSRRGNSQIMLRGTLDNIKQNLMLSKEGGFTIDHDSGEIVSIFEKAQRFKEREQPLVVFAGENFGWGVQRDWASKGVKLLGIKAIIAKSFNENYRLNLVEFGVLPLEFVDDDIESLKLKGNELISIKTDDIKPTMRFDIVIHREDIDIEIELKLRLDSELEVEYYKNGGVLNYLLKMIKG